MAPLIDDIILDPIDCNADDMPDIDDVIEDMIWLMPVEIVLPIEVNQLSNELPILLKLEVIELSVDIIELTKFEIPV